MGTRKRNKPALIRLGFTLDSQEGVVNPIQNIAYENECLESALRRLTVDYPNAAICVVRINDCGATATITEYNYWNATDLSPYLVGVAYKGTPQDIGTK